MFQKILDIQKEGVLTRFESRVYVLILVSILVCWTTQIEGWTIYALAGQAILGGLQLISASVRLLYRRRLKASDRYYLDRYCLLLVVSALTMIVAEWIEVEDFVWALTFVVLPLIISIYYTSVLFRSARLVVRSRQGQYLPHILK